ncbi:hypothetical protein [Desulfopila inferna]|uniref:hypothetical protein n=1 Tax=Desulfopila inferna TaxID=468528 RepID=UPI001965C305|nr:hypothetical protein [Desulfopila inferna]MBM9605945.1 hypothetical protein [Desulfopila inferna]
MNDMQQITKNMLADLNEVQLDLALAGQGDASEKVRKVKKQMLRFTENSENGIDALVSGYRHDALDQCERVNTMLAKIGSGEAPTDNELTFVKMASELLAQRIGVYLQRKMLVQCPGLAEV